MSTTRFFKDSRSFFNELIEKINMAQNFIVLEYYIFDPDSSVGKEILEALKSADARGVQVLLHLDGIGSRKWLIDPKPPLQLSKGEITVFNPVPWPVSRFLASEFPKVNRFLRYWSRVNHRNHRKLCVVDGHFAFVGSMNIHAHALEWVECGVMCEREVVYVLLDSYVQLRMQSFVLQRGDVNPDIFKTTLRIGSSKDAEEVLAQATRKQRAGFRLRHKRAFLEAKEDITLVTPYFVPTFWLTKALIRARKRQVEVNLVLSKKLDHPFMNWLADKYLYPLIDSGVRVYKAPQMVHAKVVMADSWIHVGSCNLNQRSLHLDMELNVQVRGEQKQQEVRQFVGQLIREAEPVSLSMLNQRPWFEKIMGTFLKLFRAIL